MFIVRFFGRFDCNDLHVIIGVWPVFAEAIITTVSDTMSDVGFVKSQYTTVD